MRRTDFRAADTGPDEGTPSRAGWLSGVRAPAGKVLSERERPTVGRERLPSYLCGIEAHLSYSHVAHPDIDFFHKMGASFHWRRVKYSMATQATSGLWKEMAEEVWRCSYGDLDGGLIQELRVRRNEKGASDGAGKRYAGGSLGAEGLCLRT